MRFRAEPLLLLIIGFFSFVYADSAIQTNWSGGSGVLGPVEYWENFFYQETNIDWNSISGAVTLQRISRHIVDATLDNPYDVYSKDIDGDGDMDVLGAIFADNDIIWWENTEGSGSSWIEHMVDGEFNGASSVYSEDIDGDGDMDILGAALIDNDVTWWENLDGSGSSWTEHVVDGEYVNPGIVIAADIDGNGTMDVLSLSYLSDTVIWWQNTDGSGTSWIEYVIDDNFDGVFSICVKDIDGDDDLDVVGEAGNDVLTWWENSDTSPGIYWTEHVVDDEFAGYYAVYSEDIDGDCDMDIIGAGALQVVWWENVDGTGSSWNMHIVDEDFNSARCLYSCDMDLDGDMDLLGAADDDDSITWWENTDGCGLSWIEHAIDEGFNYANSVYSEDIDGDGYPDVLGAAWYGNTIAWWDLNIDFTGGSLESSILDIQENPCWDCLDWNSQTPSGTSVSFLVRASDDHTDMGSWSDTLHTPCSLQGILSENDSYFQYKAVLSTSNPDITPALTDVTVTWDPMGVEDMFNTVLLPFSPNPASGTVQIRFSLGDAAPVEISIFDITGRRVNTVLLEAVPAGNHSAYLDMQTPGIYFCRMTSGDVIATQRFVVID